MKVLAFTKYSYAGPSSRYRYYNYVECFHKQGIEMDIVPFFTSVYFKSQSKAEKSFHVLKAYLKRILFLIRLLFSVQQYDLFIIEYELFPFFPAWFEWLLKIRGMKYIVDYDDAIFHKYDMHKNLIVRWFLKDKIGKVMHNAKTVIVCNDYLGMYAQLYNTYLLQLPTVVLLDKYKNIMEKYKETNTGTGFFVIGWIGSKSTSKYILDILPAIERFAKIHNVQFNLVGFDESILPVGIKDRCNINTIVWSEETEIEEILHFDVGIMPLPNDPWSQGKCGFKLVQYMSCKKPVIASPVGINISLVEENINGFLANTNDEWFDAFEKLYFNTVLRDEIGKNNLAKILLEYNHDINCDRYTKLIKILVTV